MDNQCDYLVIGANGLIGAAVAKELDAAPGAHNWVGTSFKRRSSRFRSLNILDKENIKKVFQEVKPKTVLFCSNLAGGVEFAQTHPAEAKKFYYEATQDLGEQCLKHRARLVFISTECVFDGKKEVYREEDEPNPLNLYGQWKTESEKWITKHLADSLIVRTMFVFGWQPETVTPNAVMKAYFSVSKKERMLVQAYRWGTPTYVQDLAKAMVELSVSGADGIYHVTGSTFITRYEWLKKVCRAMEWDSSWLCPLTEISPKATPYPLKLRLDTQKFRRQFKIKLHSLDESMFLFKNDTLIPSRSL